MFCQKCGAENSEEAGFCISCGDQLKKVDVKSNEPMVNLEKKVDSSEDTNQSSIQSEGIIQNQNEFQSNNDVQQVKSPLIWSILVTIFGVITCCCLNPVSAIVGIIAIVFSTQVDDRQRRGDFQGAKNAAKNAIILNWVGLGFMVLTIIIWIALFALGTINSENYPTRL